MKKSVILLALTLSVVACKKSETTNNSSEKSENSISNESKADSAAVINENFEIKSEETKKIQEKVINETKKSIDSIAKSERKNLQIIDETLPDTVVEKIAKKEVKPKVIKQTKIVYKSIKNNSEKGNPIIKSGNLSFKVENIESSLQDVKYLIKKYDGIIKTENSNFNNDYQTNYIFAKIPLKDYDYLIEDLIYKIGTATEQNLEISGENYNGNKLCNLEISLYNENYTSENTENQNFAGKTLSAFSKGWEAIGGLFLFFLPFWPVFLVGGFAFYYFKKKKNKKNNL